MRNIKSGVGIEVWAWFEVTQVVRAGNLPDVHVQDEHRNMGPHQDNQMHLWENLADRNKLLRSLP